MCNYLRVVAVLKKNIYMAIIVFDQSLNKIAIYKHKCLEIIQKILKTSGKSNNQQQ